MTENETCNVEEVTEEAPAEVMGFSEESNE